MFFINYISISAMPIIIFVIVFYGLFEKNNVYDDFLEGVKEGIEIVVNIFPTLIGLFVAIGALRSSGIIDCIINMISPFINNFGIPAEVMPLILIRPISGSGATAVAIDIMKTFGVDSKIGLIASTIMGSTETTLYIIAIYTSCVKIKKIRFVLKAALIADFVGMLTAVILCSFLS